MVNYISYRRELARLQKARRDVLKNSPKPVAGQEYEADFSAEMDRTLAEHRIYRLVSDHHYEKAFQYGVPVQAARSTGKTPRHIQAPAT